MSTSPSISHVARIWTIRKRGHQIRTYTNRPQQLSAKPSHQATVSRLSSRETVRLFLSFVPSRLLVIDFFAFSLFCRALAAAAAAAAASAVLLCLIEIFLLSLRLAGLYRLSKPSKSR